MVEYYFQPHSSWQQFSSDKKHTLKKYIFYYKNLMENYDLYKWLEGATSINQ